MIFFEINHSRKMMAERRQQQARLAAERRQQQARFNVLQGTRFMEAGDFFRSLPLFVAALNLDEDNTKLSESHKVRIASLLQQCQRIVKMRFLNDDVNGAKLSHDGRYVAAAGN